MKYHPSFRRENLHDGDFHQTVRKVADHRCLLPISETDDIVITYIVSGPFVQLRRRLRRLTMLTHHHPDSKATFRSTACRRTEQARHLKRHYSMIHPFSLFSMSWESIMLATYLTAFILMPIEMGFVNTPDILLYPKALCDLIAFLDVGINFKTGYHDPNMQWVVMTRSKVAKRYLFTYFLFDVVGSLPISFYLRYNQSWHHANLKFTYLAKLIRFHTCAVYLDRWRRRKNIKLTNSVAMIKMFLVIFMALHWSAGAFILLKLSLGVIRTTYKAATSTEAAILLYLNHYHRVVRMFMLNTVPDIGNHQWAYLMVLEVICVIAGAIINVYVLAQLFQIYGRRMNAVRKYRDLLQEISQYVQFKQLSHGLRDRIIRFVQFKFQNRLFKEEDIMRTLSRTLYQDVLYHNCKHLMEKVEFFKDLPTVAMLSILLKLKHVIYLSGDVIVQAGTVGHAMYFIYMGTVAVYTSRGQEICHLSEGRHFGEIALLINEPRVATVKALKDCDLIRLNRKDFNEAMEPYPDLKEKFAIIAMARLQDTLSLFRPESDTENENVL